VQVLARSDAAPARVPVPNACRWMMVQHETMSTSPRGLLGTRGCKPSLSSCGCKATMLIACGTWNAVSRFRSHP